MTGSEIKKWRNEVLDLSLRELAQYLRVAPSTLLRWEESNEDIRRDLEKELEIIRQKIQPNVVRLTHLNDLSTALIMIAMSKETSSGKTQKTRKSFFEEERLQVETKSFFSSESTFWELLEGRADAAVAYEDVYKTIDKPGLKRFATLLIPSDSISAIATRQLEIHGPRDFQQYKIGVLRGGYSAHLLINKLSNYFEEGADKFEFYKTLDTNVIAYDLINERIDLFVGVDPFMAELKKQLWNAKQGHIDIPLTSYIGLGLKPLKIAIVVSEQILQHPRTIRGIARALLKASSFLNIEKRQSRHILATALNADEELINLSSWEQLDFTVKIPNDILVDYLITT